MMRLLLYILLLSLGTSALAQSSSTPCDDSVKLAFLGIDAEDDRSEFDTSDCDNAVSGLLAFQLPTLQSFPINSFLFKPQTRHKFSRPIRAPPSSI